MSRSRWVTGAVVVAACATVWVVTAASLLLLSPSRRPAEVQTWVIPSGAADRIAAGENPLALPPSLVLLAGDTLRFVNHDAVDHTIGAWRVPAGAERRVRFARPIDGSLACSVHPAGLLGLEVRPRGLDLSLTVVPTIVLGPALAAVALGVRAVLRRLGDDRAAPMVVASIALLALTGCRASTPDAQTFHGAELVPPVDAPELGLRDASGAPFRVGDQRGKVVLVTFGYTHCPDFCPGTLAQYKATKEALGADADRTRFVFVTVDPERDTPDVLGRYVAYFDPSFVGLSGEPAEVAAVTAAWGVTAERDPGGSGTFTHATTVFVVDQHGRLRLAHPYGMPTGALVEDVRVLLAERTGPAPLRVADPWARAVPATSGVGAVFLTVVNNGAEDDALVAADVDPAVADRVELHRSLTTGGVTTMTPVERIPVPGRGRIRLEPGSWHLMLQGLRHDLAAGQQVSLTLHFERAGRVPVTASVRLDATPGDGPAPHHEHHPEEQSQRNTAHE